MTIDMVAVDAFLKGCSNKQAALTVADKFPGTVDEAVNLVKSAEHNQRVVLGSIRSNPNRVRQVTFAPDAESAPLVRAAALPVNESSAETHDNRLKKIEDRTSRLETQVDCLVSGLEAM
jgi:hypothetical protein